jgi:hypothetical protein
MTMKIPHSAIVRAPALLPMRYKIHELEHELGVESRLIRAWVRTGLVFERDRRGHFFIHGHTLARWIERQRQNSRSRVTLAEGQAYCFSCRKAVHITGAQKIFQPQFRLLSGSCAECGGKVNRGISDGQAR